MVNTPLMKAQLLYRHGHGLVDIGAQWVRWWCLPRAIFGGYLGACGRVALLDENSYKNHEMAIESTPYSSPKTVRFFVLAAK